MADHTHNIEDILSTHQKQLKGIRELERRLIQVDQLIASLKAKKSQADLKLKNLFQKKESVAIQKTALQKILDDSTKASFVEIQPFHLLQLKKIWQKQDPELFNAYINDESKYNHYPKKFYLGRSDRILRIVFLDQGRNYHFTDLNIPNNLTWGV